MTERAVATGESLVERAAGLPGQMAVQEALAVLAAARTDQVVVTTMGSIREWSRVSRHPLDFHYIPSAMGQGSSLGLGIALARPERRVIVLNGDGSMLMNLGSLVTIAAQGPRNYYLIVIDNGVYEITGGQLTAGTRLGTILLGHAASGQHEPADMGPTAPVPSQAGQAGFVHVDYPGLARAAGFARAYRFNDVEKWQAEVREILTEPGPVLISLEVAPVPGAGTPKSPGPMRERVGKLRAALAGVNDRPA